MAAVQKGRFDCTPIARHFDLRGITRNILVVLRKQTLSLVFPPLHVIAFIRLRVDLPGVSSLLG